MIANLAWLVAAVPVWAHHAFADEFDAQKPVKFRGTVTKMEWINPHAWIHIDVKGEDGQVVQWLAETQAPNTVYTEGYRPNSFKPDDEITVTVRPAANGRPYGLLTQAVLADGTKLGSEEGARGRGAAAQ